MRIGVVDKTFVRDAYLGPIIGYELYRAPRVVYFMRGIVNKGGFVSAQTRAIR